jgi:hypothetical protein
MFFFEGEGSASLLVEGATLAPIMDVLIHLDYMKEEDIDGEID